MFSAGTQFKQTARKFRQSRFKAGRNYVQVYKDAYQYKLVAPVLGPLQTTESDITHISAL